MEFPQPVTFMIALRHVLPALAGAGIGYGYYLIVGCTTGACPITSSPWMSALFGAAIGWLIVPRTPKQPGESSTMRKD